MYALRSRKWIGVSSLRYTFSAMRLLSAVPPEGSPGRKYKSGPKGAATCRRMGRSDLAQAEGGDVERQGLQAPGPSRPAHRRTGALAKRARERRPIVALRGRERRGQQARTRRVLARGRRAGPPLRGGEDPRGVDGVPGGAGVVARRRGVRAPLHRPQRRAETLPQKLPGI